MNQIYTWGNNIWIQTMSTTWEKLSPKYVHLDSAGTILLHNIFTYEEIMIYSRGEALPAKQLKAVQY